MKRYLLSLPLLFLLTACATTQNYRAAAHSWVGENVQSLIDHWGYPNAVKQAPNSQNKLYIYKTDKRGKNPTITTPGQTTVSTKHGETSVQTSPTTTSGGGTYNLQCTTWFVVNKKHIIVDVTFRGNNCAATRGAATQLAKPTRAH